MLAAKAYARRTYPELEYPDYVQYASIGLIEAVDRFDNERGIAFEAFAAPRITGAILNGIEALSEKQVQVSARKRLVDERMRSMRDVAPVPGDADSLFSHLAEVAIGLAVGFMLEDTGMYHADAGPSIDITYQRVEMKQLRQRLLSLLDRLPANERKVIACHYLQRMSFSDISRMLGLSNGRISQIHKSALSKLRTSFHEDERIDVSF